MDRSRILEFLLRPPMGDSPTKGLLGRLPIPLLLGPRLKRTLFLRHLSSDLSAGDLSGDTLQALELLEELDRAFGCAQASDALKAAYAAVAAELTAATLRSGSLADFFEAVNRIWNCRVGDLERSEARGMMGEALREWRRRMEEAVVSDSAREEVLRRDTRGEAMEALREYLRVALKETGPPSLERAARAVGGRPDAGGGEGIDEIAGEKEAARDPGVSSESNDAIGAAPMEFSGLDQAAAVIGVEAGPLVPETEMCKRSTLAGQTDAPSQDRISKELDCLSMLEVNKVKKALKSSCAELRKAVEDPLPNALARASEIQNSMVEKSDNPHDANKGQNWMDVGAPGPSNQMEAQAAVTETAAAQDCNGISCPAKPRLSLMERNPTARAYVWDEDSIEVSSDNSPNSPKRLHLPIPSDWRVSPLQPHKFKKFVRRRKIKRWTPEEEDALREAVKKHGKGNWKFILQHYRGMFEDRTEVDLKDKWRNMTK